MINKNILLFILKIYMGGVEKNYFIIAEYFAKRFRKVSVITTSKNYKSKLDDGIEFISPKNIFWNKSHNKNFKIFIFLYLVFKYFHKNRINFINVGRLVDQKNQIIILKTFKKFNIKNKLNFKLLIVGRGKNQSVLRGFILRNHLANYIKIIHYKGNSFPYIKNSDGFILSSLYERLPNVLLEALILKKIIISSNCPTGPKKILDSGKGGLLFDFKNENDLYEKIIFYLNNKKKCKKLTLHGHKKLKRFDLNINLKKYASAMKV